MFQSCFEIIEQVFIKNDGSGNFQLIVNMSKSRSRLNSIMKMKKVNGHDVPTKDEMSQKIADIERVFIKTPGINNVKKSIDFDNYIFTLSCNFTSVTKLNTVVKAIKENENDKTNINEQFYAWDNITKTFTRLNKNSFKKEYQKLSNADKEVFSSANFTTIFKFESAIASASNKEANLSSNKKAVMLKMNLLDLVTDKKSIENKINLTK